MIKEEVKKPLTVLWPVKRAVCLLILHVRSQHLRCQVQSHQMAFVRRASSAKLLNWSYWLGKLDCLMGLNWLG